MRMRLSQNTSARRGTPVRTPSAPRVAIPNGKPFQHLELGYGPDPIFRSKTINS